jgi:peroxiredoxin
MRALLAALILGFYASPALAAAPPAPAFTLKLLDGSGTFDSRALLGKNVLVVRFQASWCKICAEEAPMIERVYEKYRTSGVEVVAVQIQDTDTDAGRFLKAHGATYPAGLDPRLKIANRFGFKGTPYTVVINKRGEIVTRIRGRTDEAKLGRVLDPLVKPASNRKPPARLQ